MKTAQDVGVLYKFKNKFHTNTGTYIQMKEHILKRRNELLL